MKGNEVVETGVCEKGDSGFDRDNVDLFVCCDSAVVVDRCCRTAFVSSVKRRNVYFSSQAVLLTARLLGWQSCRRTA